MTTKPIIKRKNKTVTLDELKARWLKDPEIKAAYDAMELEFAIASAVIKARAKAGLSQSALAEHMGTKQSYIARLESGRELPAMKTLRRVAEATGLKAKFQFVAGD
jgi:ribosome-binding protein aMBF1 (putative translation factor)